MDWCRGWQPQVNKIEIQRKLQKNMDHAYRTRWSGQGCINKLSTIKQSGILGNGHFCILILIYSYHQVYQRGHGMELCRCWMCTKNYKYMYYTYRRRWSGQRCINKLIAISIIMYVLKQGGILGGVHFWNMKLI